ncbi:MAG: hypothetical protein AB7I50_08165 [Vicinamibacterales bacterium]
MNVVDVAIDASKWSGEGTFTKNLLEVLRAMPGLAGVRVEDSPSSRSDPTFLFISNELYLALAGRGSLQTVSASLAADPRIGPADYEDEGMVQYLRTERVIPPYQTRGYKLVEMVRIYLIPPRS